MIFDEKGNIFDIVDFQKKTINATIDAFVYHCEKYMNPINGSLDMNDIIAIAKLMKGVRNKNELHTNVTK